MGIIVKEEYICDFCQQPIDGGAMVGRLELRKAGSRGMGKRWRISTHEECARKLTEHATPQQAAPLPSRKVT